MRRKAERVSLIRQMARELAATGDYANAWTIEQVIRGRGHVDARFALDNRTMRSELDAICSNARATLLNAEFEERAFARRSG